MRNKAHNEVTSDKLTSGNGIFESSIHLVVVTYVESANVRSGAVLGGNCVRSIGQLDLYGLNVIGPVEFCFDYVLFKCIPWLGLVAFPTNLFHNLWDPNVKNIIWHLPWHFWDTVYCSTVDVIRMRREKAIFLNYYCFSDDEIRPRPTIPINVMKKTIKLVRLDHARTIDSRRARNHGASILIYIKQDVGFDFPAAAHRRVV